MKAGFRAKKNWRGVVAPNSMVFFLAALMLKQFAKLSISIDYLFDYWLRLVFRVMHMIARSKYFRERQCFGPLLNIKHIGRSIKLRIPMDSWFFLFLRPIVPWRFHTSLLTKLESSRCAYVAEVQIQWSLNCTGNTTKGFKR